MRKEVGCVLNPWPFSHCERSWQANQRALDKSNSFMISCLMSKAHQIDIRRLHTFVTVVDAGGVHRAAARLHVTQSALSRQIQALEAELGVPLFDRVGRRVLLTAEGEDLLRRGR